MTRSVQRTTAHTLLLMWRFVWAHLEKQNAKHQRVYNNSSNDNIRWYECTLPRWNPAKITKGIVWPAPPVLPRVWNRGFVPVIHEPTWSKTRAAVVLSTELFLQRWSSGDQYYHWKPRALHVSLLPLRLYISAKLSKCQRLCEMQMTLRLMSQERYNSNDIHAASTKYAL